MENLSSLLLGVDVLDRAVQRELAEQRATEAGRETEIVQHPGGRREHGHVILPFLTKTAPRGTVLLTASAPARRMPPLPAPARAPIAEIPRWAPGDV